MKTKKQKQTKNKKSWLLAAIIAIILISSTAGFLINSREPEEKTMKYKGHDIVQTSQGWALILGDTALTLSYNPLELENITLGYIPSLDELNAAEKIYLSLNPNQNLYAALRDFSQLKITPRIINSCYDDISGCENLPLKTCSDTSESTKVILMRTDANETNINYNSGCFTIEATDAIELTKAIDKLMLEMIGI